MSNHWVAFLLIKSLERVLLFGCAIAALLWAILTDDTDYLFVHLPFVLGIYALHLSTRLWH